LDTVKEKVGNVLETLSQSRARECLIYAPAAVVE